MNDIKHKAIGGFKGIKNVASTGVGVVGGGIGGLKNVASTGVGVVGVVGGGLKNVASTGVGAGLKGVKGGIKGANRVSLMVVSKGLDGFDGLKDKILGEEEEEVLVTLDDSDDDYFDENTQKPGAAWGGMWSVKGFDTGGDLSSEDEKKRESAEDSDDSSSSDVFLEDTKIMSVSAHSAESEATPVRKSKYANSKSTAISSMSEHGTKSSANANRSKSLALGGSSLHEDAPKTTVKRRMSGGALADKKQAMRDRKANKAADGYGSDGGLKKAKAALRDKKANKDLDGYGSDGGLKKKKQAMREKKANKEAEASGYGSDGGLKKAKAALRDKKANKAADGYGSDGGLKKAKAKRRSVNAMTERKTALREARKKEGRISFSDDSSVLTMDSEAPRARKSKYANSKSTAVSSTSEHDTNSSRSVTKSKSMNTGSSLHEDAPKRTVKRRMSGGALADKKQAMRDRKANKETDAEAEAEAVGYGSDGGLKKAKAKRRSINAMTEKKKALREAKKQSGDDSDGGCSAGASVLVAKKKKKKVDLNSSRTSLKSTTSRASTRRSSKKKGDVLSDSTHSRSTLKSKKQGDLLSDSTHSRSTLKSKKRATTLEEDTKESEMRRVIEMPLVIEIEVTEKASSSKAAENDEAEESSTPKVHVDSNLKCEESLDTQTEGQESQDNPVNSMVASMGKMATGVGSILSPNLLLAKLNQSQTEGQEETKPEGESEEGKEENPLNSPGLNSMVASMGRMATGIGGKLPPALLLAKLKGSKSPEETNPEDTAGVTNGSSVWDKLKVSAHIIEKSKKNAGRFDKLFDEEKEVEDRDVYVASGQKETQAKQRKVVDAKEARANAKEIDDKLAEIENMENTISKERHEMENERNTVAFERESLELQLNEEVEKNHKLNLQVFELEEDLRCEKAGGEEVDPRNITMLTGENETLKIQLEREKRDSHLFLSEKDEEIKKLQKAIQGLQQEEEPEDIKVIPGGKSRERLQGELLHAVTKLHDREAIIHKQQKEVEDIKQELANLRLGVGLQDFKDEIAALMEQKEELQAKHGSETEKLEEKMKEKDETVVFFIGELAKLKQELSEQKRQPPPAPSIITSWMGVSSEPPPKPKPEPVPVPVRSFAFAPRARRGSEDDTSVGGGSLGDEASEEDKVTPEEVEQTPEEVEQTPEVTASWGLW